MSSSLPVACHLAGVVHNHLPGKLEGDGEFRRYAGCITTALRRNDVQEMSNKAIFYEIGRRFKDDNRLHTRVRNVADKIGMPSVFNSVMTAGLKGTASRTSHFLGEWTHFDFLGMISLLSAAIAKFSITETLTCAEIRRGLPANVRSLNVVVEPVQADDKSVYIPRCSDSLITTAVFSALVAAANGTGSGVVTDYLCVDGNQVPTFSEATGADLAAACISGLRILMSIYSLCDDGELAALALTTGIHRIVSVVSHSDEGGIVRDILRACDFKPSFGGIYNPDYASYLGLPVPHTRDIASITTWVDNIALLTAGAVAVAAPMTVIDGRAYPKLFTSTIVRVDDVDNAPAGTLQDEANIRHQIALDHHEFTAVYPRVLAEIFKVNDSRGRGGIILGFMTETCCLADMEIKHFRSKTVAPWFWIEPTSLFKDRFDSEATRNGYGPICGVRSPHHMNTFESVSVGHTTALTTALVVGMRCPRTSGYLLHLSSRATDGLANIIPVQLDPNNVSCKGGGDGPMAALTNNRSMAEWVWGRSQSPIFHPAEFNYIGKAMLLKMAKMTFDPDTMEYTRTSLHLTEEMVGGVVAISACSPERLDNGRVHQWTRARRHNRTHAHISLANAARRMKNYFDSCPMMPSVSFSEPLLRVPENTVHVHTDSTLMRADENMSDVILPIPHAGTPIPHVITNQALRPISQKLTTTGAVQRVVGSTSPLGVMQTVTDAVIDEITTSIRTVVDDVVLDEAIAGGGSEMMNSSRITQTSSPARGGGGGGADGGSSHNYLSSGVRFDPGANTTHNTFTELGSAPAPDQNHPTSRDPSGNSFFSGELPRGFAP